MRFATSAVTALIVLQPTLANPVPSESDTTALSQRQPDAIPDIFERALPLSALGFEKKEAEADVLNTHDLEKRRGGGGRGGGSSGGSSSGSSSSGSSSSGGSSGGGSRGGSNGGSSSGGSSGGSRGGSSSGSSGSSSGSSGSTGSSSGSRGGSSFGGSSSSGSRGSSGASSPSYGGGRYYGGGSTTSYRSGSRSPGGIVPFALGGAALGFAGAAVFWPHAYVYPWNTGYQYSYNRRNGTNRTSTRLQRREDVNVTLPVKCLCNQDQSCGCDDNNNGTYFDELFGDDGFNDTVDDTLATIQTVNGTDTVILNGTLTSDARSMLRVQTGGYVVMAAGLAVSLWVL